MTTEFILLLGIYTGILFKVLMALPAETYKKATPFLAAKIERDLAVGRGFTTNQREVMEWQAPTRR